MSFSLQEKLMSITSLTLLKLPSMRRLMTVATLAVVAGGTVGPAWAGPGDSERLGLGAPGMSQRMLEKVGASAEQRSQIDKIMVDARSDLRAQRDEGRDLHEKMRSLFTQPTVDEAAVEEVRQKMQAHHDAASRRMTQAMIQASRVLTVEQRQKMAELMSARMAERAKRHDRGDRPDSHRRHDHDRHGERKPAA